MTAPPETVRGTEASESRLPPVAQVAVASMALVIASGIYLAAHLPHRPPLGPAVGLLAVAGVLLVADLVVVSRLRPFNWEVFFRVGGWALLAYAVIAGMLEFIFVFDHTRGAPLVVFTLSLLVFAFDIPLILAFSVARYQAVEPLS
jgi:hypothetical protein